MLVKSIFTIELIFMIVIKTTLIFVAQLIFSK